MTGFEFLLLRIAPFLLHGAAALLLLVLAGTVAGWWEPQWHWLTYLAFAALATLGLLRWAEAVRERFIRETALPQTLKRRLRSLYPHLTPKDCELAERALRQFFLACLRGNGNFVAMPSKAADAMWAAFVRLPQAYAAWSHHALGQLPEHSPAQVLGKKLHGNDGLRRTWYWTCKEEAIDPRKPSRLPLLFALDAKLNIPDGFIYATGVAPAAPEGRARGIEATHFGTSFSDPSYAGHAQDFGGAEPRRSGLSFLDSDSGTDGSDGDGGGDGGGGD